MINPQFQVTPVRRGEEIDMVQDRLGQMAYGGAVVQAILNFIGVVGIGKTSLLYQILEEFQKQKTPVVFVDLGKAEYQKPEEGRLSILTDILQGLSGIRISLRAFLLAKSQLEEMYKNQRDEDGNLKDDIAGIRQREEQMESVKNEFTGLLTKWLHRPDFTPLVLLFDNTDRTNSQVMDWLEESVISPLIRTDRVLAVFAGRSPVRWKRFEVRRRVLQHKLQPFDKGQTSTQIQKYKKLSDKIIGLTFGHPYGNAQVAESVYSLETRAQETITEENFDTYRVQLMNELTNVLIDRHIMRDVPPELKQALRIISILRHFDVNALRVILTKFLSPQFGGKGGSYYLSMVARMVETTLVEWDSVRKGYAIDLSVRRMLALHLQLNEQDLYLAINREAINLYKEWIERIAENRSGFIIEYIYHRSNVLKIENKPQDKIGEELAGELTGYLSRHYVRDVDTAAVMRLCEELKTDTEIEENIPGGLKTLVEAVNLFINNSH